MRMFAGREHPGTPFVFCFNSLMKADTSGREQVFCTWFCKRHIQRFTKCKSAPGASIDRGDRRFLLIGRSGVVSGEHMSRCMQASLMTAANNGSTTLQTK